MDRRKLIAMGLTAGLVSLTRPALAGKIEVAATPFDGAAPPSKPGIVGSVSRSLRRVMIDPGHGGKDPGCIGVSGTHEKDVVLDIALKAADILSKGGQVQPMLTREDDTFLSLGERVAKTRAEGVDLFLSIHADSAPTPLARGLSAYTVAERASDSFSEALAQQENLVDGAAGIALAQQDAEVQKILVDLTVRHTRRAALLAKRMIVDGAGTRDIRLLENPERSANFVVLRAPDTPSVLIETGFLSNGDDEKLLCNEKNRAKVAAMLAERIAAILSDSAFL